MSAKIFLTSSFLCLIFLTHVQSYEVIADTLCNCKDVDIVSNRDIVLRKHGDVLGRYTQIEGAQGGSSTPSYMHSSGKFFLYYSSQSQGFWAVGETLGGEIVRLENQGDQSCPYYLKSIWRYADGELNSLVYDISLKVACMSDSCSVAHCGHQAKCLNSTNLQETELKGDTAATCVCEDNFEGDPYERCYPKEVPEAPDCDCRRLIFSTHNPLAATKHANSYGEFFLFDVKNGSPIYQHFAGIEYLYERGGHWLISDKVGLQEAGLQNQGDISGPSCPYLLRSSWEYADVDQPGWQWVYDYTANLMCPQDPCSVNKCGYHATCVVDGGRHRTLCACDSGYEGDPYDRCFPKAPSSCGCKILELSSVGPSALAQADKMGSYYLHGYYNRRPAYQHQSGLDYLYYADGEAWVVGATFGGPRVGIVNFDRKRCPYAVAPGTWRHSVNGKLELDQGILISCVDPALTEETEFETESSNFSTVASTESESDEGDSTTVSPAPVQQNPTQKTLMFANSSTTFSPSTRLQGSTARPTNINDLTVQRKETDSKPIQMSPPVPQDLSPEESIQHSGVSVIETTLCDCPEIEVTSQNPTTLEKHAAQLGSYRLIRVQGGRPIYQHIDTKAQFLYYHPYSGGNWLINSEVGLLYGGIQNSKDTPLCPYLLNTMWQYGDGDLHGWVYDPSLRVTCPTDPCSVLRCGFRADCVRDNGKNSTRCQCQQGFSGNPYERCFPDDPLTPCTCQRLKLASTGPASEHQRDKLGNYFHWGKHNNKPVYQHESGLDFLYYHTNQVWGVGPKVGGNSAGLLNFGRQPCPYDLVSPWEFGTRQKNGQRQTDVHLKLVCLDNEWKKSDSTPSSTTPVPPAPLKVGMDLVNNALSFVASIGNKLTQPPSSPVTPKPQSTPTNLCGWSSYGQDGGNSFGVHPWLASITVIRGDQSDQACLGVIASQKHIITTASCVTSHPMNRYRVVIGDIVPDRREEFSVQSIMTHDKYSDEDGENDIAVVMLKQKLDSEEGRYINFDGIVRPLCLPELNSSTYFDHCETLPQEPSRPGYVSVIETCMTQKEDANLMCATSKSKTSSPIICRDSRLRLAVLAGLPTKNCHLDCHTKSTFLPIESYTDWIKTKFVL